MARLRGREDLHQLRDDRARQRAARDHRRKLPPERRIPAEHRNQQARHDVGEDHRHDRRDPDESRERHLEVHGLRVAELRLRDRLVEQVRHAARDDHHHAHHEDPHQELHLHGGIADSDEDERDERDAGHAVSLETVSARTDRVPGVVPSAVRDDPGIPRIVFLDVEDDLHQVRADVGNLREDPAGNPERRGAERFTDGEADEAGARIVARDEEQDAQHHEELDADEQHADAHAGAQRNRVDGIRHAPKAREGRPRVRERVDADAEPRHAVAAADADQTEEKDDDDLDGLHVLERAEVEHHDDADEHFQEEDELALRDQVGLARLVDQLRDLEHRLMDGQVLELPEDHHAERETEQAHDEPGHQQRSAVDALKRGLTQIR